MYWKGKNTNLIIKVKVKVRKIIINWKTFKKYSNNKMAGI